MVAWLTLTILAKASSNISLGYIKDIWNYFTVISKALDISQQRYWCDNLVSGLPVSSGTWEMACAGGTRAAYHSRDRCMPEPLAEYHQPLFDLGVTCFLLRCHKGSHSLERGQVEEKTFLHVAKGMRESAQLKHQITIILTKHSLQSES